MLWVLIRSALVPTTYFFLEKKEKYKGFSVKKNLIWSYELFINYFKCLLYLDGILFKVVACFSVCLHLLLQSENSSKDVFLQMRKMK